MKIVTLTFAVSVSIILSCTIHGVNNHLNPKAIDKLPPRVEIEVPQIISFNQKLEFNWRISNPNDIPLYIYSSLLKQSTFAEIVVNSEKKTIEVYFTRTERLPIAPNFFPKTEFSEVSLNKAFDGRFIEENTIGEKALYKDKNGNAELQQIKSGKWQIRVAVAYGYEIDSLKNAINEKSQEIETHPINTVVDWQKIAYSEFKTVLIENNK